jgi:dipeptidyl aminopeptidase/acylaminoacyl peptidase
VRHVVASMGEITTQGSVAAIVAVVTTLALVAGGAGATPATSESISIVAARAVDLLPEIYSVAADGTDRVDLTNSPGFADGWPAVSPDGQRIAFVSSRNGRDELYVMNADGSGPQRVCPADSMPEGPCVGEKAANNVGGGAISDLVWSPDGHTLGFFSGLWTYIVDLAGGHAQQLGYARHRVQFSSDGRFVAWTTYNADCFTNCAPPTWVEVERTAGGGRIVSVPNLGAARRPRRGARFVAWAPRAPRFLYERTGVGGVEDAKIATSDLSGRHLRVLVPAPSTVWQIAPDWSPSGRRVAFFREGIPCGGGGCRVQGLYIVDDATRRLPRRLHRLSANVASSAWSPNGTWIAFGGNRGVFIIRSNGQGLRRVTGAPALWTPPILGADSAPLLWSPDSRHLAFVDSDGVVRVVDPLQSAAVAVGACGTTSELCPIAWAGDRLLFASSEP